MRVVDLLPVTFLAYPITTVATDYNPSTACVSGNAVHILGARGTTESQTDHGGVGAMYQVITQVIDRLPGSNFEGVRYPANFDQPASNSQGTGNMTLQITAYSDRCPGSKLVLMGYSQGAQVVGDTVSGGGTGTPDNHDAPWYIPPPRGNGGRTAATPPLAATIASRVVALVLLGDPTRVRNAAYDKDQTPCLVDAPYARTGALNTKWQSYASRTSEYCDQWDKVCCDSPDATDDRSWTHGVYLGYDYIRQGIVNFVAARAGA